MVIVVALLLKREQDWEQEHKGDLEQVQLLILNELLVLDKEEWSLYMATFLFFLK